jgi:hypothetical protein
VDPSTETPSFALQCLQAGVPLIFSNHESQVATFGDAALFTAPHHQQIAEKMMAIYKDEEMRNAKISKGLELAKNYTWELAATGLWQTILEATEA